MRAQQHRRTHLPRFPASTREGFSWFRENSRANHGKRAMGCCSSHSLSSIRKGGLVVRSHRLLLWLYIEAIYHWVVFLGLANRIDLSNTWRVVWCQTEVCRNPKNRKSRLWLGKQWPRALISVVRVRSRGKRSCKAWWRTWLRCNALFK